VQAYKVAATTDPLTGQLNRRGFFEVTGILLDRRRNKGKPISVLAVGDAVLQLFARVARQTMRANDVIAGSAARSLSPSCRAGWRRPALPPSACARRSKR
jgi:GGDEF domain-containing protein